MATPKNSVSGVELKHPMIPHTNKNQEVLYRGLSRLISRQKGTVFNHSDYGKIQKVYSIWICPDPSKENMNSIAEYGITQKKAIGRVNEPVSNYDKMEAIIISLNDEGMDSRTDIIRLLSTLLSTTESVEKRKQVLESEFHIPMTKEIEEGMQSMCNYGSAIQNYGEQKGVEKTILTTIRNLKETLNLSTQQAMDAMKVPKDEQKRYAQML